MPLLLLTPLEVDQAKKAISDRSPISQAAIVVTAIVRRIDARGEVTISDEEARICRAALRTAWRFGLEAQLTAIVAALERAPREERY